MRSEKRNLHWVLIIFILIFILGFTYGLSSSKKKRMKSKSKKEKFHSKKNRNYNKIDLSPSQPKHHTGYLEENIFKILNSDGSDIVIPLTIAFNFFFYVFWHSDCVKRLYPLTSHDFKKENYLKRMNTLRKKNN